MEDLMSMKRVVLGLMLVLAIGVLAVPSQAFLFGGCGCSCCSCTPCAPYNVEVTYTPIEPQPLTCTYCTTLPYGCPDGKPVVAGCAAPCGTCAAPAACAPACGLNLGGLCAMPCQILGCATGLVGGVLDCAVSTVGCVLNSLCCFNPCGGAAAAPCMTCQ
jgi:hypothetical protein